MLIGVEWRYQNVGFMSIILAFGFCIRISDTLKAVNKDFGLFYAHYLQH